uniref:Uncharacterized protein n=1 Tax=Nelumbo nucifera TaxID=4432 RepID=A0A822YVY7_NELNU|nr:TPA_asm: hypothetical protein HUJ06_005925 [Nelumbo nucifera]
MQDFNILEFNLIGIGLNNLNLERFPFSSKIKTKPFPLEWCYNTKQKQSKHTLIQ